MTRLPDNELANYEDAVAVTLRIQARIRRVVYLVDDPDALADLVGIAEDAARIRQITLAELERRKGKKSDRPGAAGLG